MRKRARMKRAKERVEKESVRQKDQIKEGHRDQMKERQQRVKKRKRDSGERQREKQKEIG